MVWYNNSWLGFLKILNYVPKEREKISVKTSPHLSQLNVAISLIGIILGKMICKSSNWQHIQRLKITILGANWQLFRLERIAKCSYFILSTQNIKFYWFVMKIKKFLLPIWWYNRGSFPLGNKYFGVFVLNGLMCHHSLSNVFQSRTYFALHATGARRKSLSMKNIYQGGISSSVLSVFFTDKFALSQSDARISVAYNSCQWKTLTKRLMKCPPDENLLTEVIFFF